MEMLIFLSSLLLLYVAAYTPLHPLLASARKFGETHKAPAPAYPHITVSGSSPDLSAYRPQRKHVPIALIPPVRLATHNHFNGSSSRNASSTIWEEKREHRKGVNLRSNEAYEANIAQSNLYAQSPRGLLNYPYWPYHPVGQKPRPTAWRNPGNSTWLGSPWHRRNNTDVWQQPGLPYRPSNSSNGAIWQRWPNRPPISSGWYRHGPRDSASPLTRPQAPAPCPNAGTPSVSHPIRKRLPHGFPIHP
ncbi:hypothetical protein KP509_11G090100 [Ceratopteris richardii]|uniref:Uncharacterized protein n=1 Tax=Ceratopteris richardii TaxID=49495 RepID=A0A8T2TUW3_CERRI|nr:hypothetical protein KP509_11G090100 [Ceratopteris richardii]